MADAATETTEKRGRKHGSKVKRRVTFRGDVLEKALRERGWSQREFARRIGTTDSHMSSLIATDLSNPGAIMADTLWVIARALDMPMEAFVQELEPDSAAS